MAAINPTTGNLQDILAGYSLQVFSSSEYKIHMVTAVSNSRYQTIIPSFKCNKSA